jgi:hypothetical protein
MFQHLRAALGDAVGIVHGQMVQGGFGAGMPGTGAYGANSGKPPKYAV